MVIINNACDTVDTTDGYSSDVNEILDDIFDSLKSTPLIRENLKFVDFVTLKPVPEYLKLSKLKLISKKQKEMEKIQKEKAPSKQALIPKDKIKKPEAEKRKKQFVILYILKTNILKKIKLLKLFLIFSTI